jgi:hypothetical protein
MGQGAWKRTATTSAQKPPAPPLAELSGDPTLVSAWIAKAREIAADWQKDAICVGVVVEAPGQNGHVSFARRSPTDFRAMFRSPASGKCLMVLKQQNLPVHTFPVDRLSDINRFAVPLDVADLTEAVDRSRRDNYKPDITRAELRVFTAPDGQPIRCAWVLYNFSPQFTHPYCYDAVKNQRIPYLELFAEQEAYQAEINKRINEMVDKLQNINYGQMAPWRQHGDLVDVPFGESKVQCARVPVSINGATVNMLVPMKALTSEQARAASHFQQVGISVPPGVAFVEAGGFLADASVVARTLEQTYSSSR